MAEQETESALAQQVEAPPSKKADQLRQTIYGYREHFALALQSADGRPLISPEKFARAAFTAINAVPELGNATLPSMMGALLGAAQLGLEPGPLGQVYLVPFKRNNQTVAQLIIGYQGLIDLAYRSGRVMSIKAEIVREHDEFEVELGSNARMIHKPPRIGEERGAMIGAQARAVIAGGGEVFEVMSKAQIDAIKSRSKAQGNHSPWATDYDAMARKTVIRQLFKWLPSSVENQMALGADGGVWREVPDDPKDAIDSEIIDVEAVEED